MRTTGRMVISPVRKVLLMDFNVITLRVESIPQDKFPAIYKPEDYRIRQDNSKGPVSDHNGYTGQYQPNGTSGVATGRYRRIRPLKRITGLAERPDMSVTVDW